MAETRQTGLVSSPVAARALGISARTLQRYVTRGLVRPALTLPSGHYRWRVPDLIESVAQDVDVDDG